MTVDWSFRIGDLLSFLGFALGGLSVIFLMRVAIEKLTLRVEMLETTISNQSKEIKELAEVLIAMARYDEKFVNVDAKFVMQQQQINDSKRDIDDLRRGRGYIKDTGK